MKFGLYVRNMGDVATTETIRECARGAEAVGLDEVWVTDHIAIPPDDAEGSGGRYLDPLATLAWLAGCTERIHLGTGVLVLPYRPALPTAKWIATIQELSGGRLLLGVGIGWMDAEFRAVGVDRRQRGRISDETLAFFEQCFAQDEVEAKGQPMLFRPRPPKPPLFVGGAAPYATRRAVRFGGGWMPMGIDPEKLRAPVASFREESAAAGNPNPDVVLATGLDVSDPAHGAAQARAFQEIGVTRIVQGGRYPNAKAFLETAEGLARVREQMTT